MTETSIARNFTHKMAAFESYIKQIRLFQFKNFTQQKIQFSPSLNVITGPNGTGKTNLLDAVHYLALTKSYFHTTDQPAIQYGKNGFRLEGEWWQNGVNNRIVCVVQEGMKKQISLNEIPYQRISEHIGRFPVVVIAPDDMHMIMGISEERRKWLDSLLSQSSIEYLSHLITYQKILAQRNQLLRQIAEHPSGAANELLDAYDQQWIPQAEYIYQYRQQICQQLIPLTIQLYTTLSGNREKIELIYESQLHQKPMTRWLQEMRTREMQAGRSLVGIHRDDLQFLLNGYPVKIHGSQGQRKSFLLALKLAQLQLLRKQKGITPVLMLDDIFEKLDPKRIQLLLSIIHLEGFGQVLITDTDMARLSHLLPSTFSHVQFIALN